MTDFFGEVCNFSAREDGGDADGPAAEIVSGAFHDRFKRRKTPARKNVRFSTPVAELAARYGQGERTINRWVSIGKKAGDIPPLDDPCAMPAWWDRHFKHRCPEKLLEIAKKFTRSVNVAGEEKKQRAEAPARKADGSVSGSGSGGFENMLIRVRSAEERAGRVYFEALEKDPDDARLPSLRKTWQEIGKQLRELERDSGDILARSGKMVSRDAVEKVLADIHPVIARGIRTLWPRIRGQMRGVSDAEQDRIWAHESERLIRRLSETGFAEYE